MKDVNTTEGTNALDHLDQYDELIIEEFDQWRNPSELALWPTTWSAPADELEVAA